MGGAETATATSAGRIGRVQVCIVYDCLFPSTIGGAERWYRNVAEALAARGARRHVPDAAAVGSRRASRTFPVSTCVAVGPRMALYTDSGRRRLLPPLVFGLGVLRHLLRHGRRYDVVHTASFPYFSLLAAAALRRRGGYRIVVDWHEVWTREYWREYLGRLGGAVGWRVQRACLRVPQRAFCFSRLHERRLRELGRARRADTTRGAVRRPARAGRAHAGAGRSPCLRDATSRRSRFRRSSLRSRSPASRFPDLRGEIYGDGPERAKVVAAIDRARSRRRSSSRRGSSTARCSSSALATAMCLVLPSRREGYGRVVIEASARGVPVVVVAGPDNAATELVEEGVNGTIAASAQPRDLASAMVDVASAGVQLRASTSDWFRRNAERLSAGASLPIVLRGLLERCKRTLVGPERRLGRRFPREALGPACVPHG